MIVFEFRTPRSGLHISYGWLALTSAGSLLAVGFRADPNTHRVQRGPRRLERHFARLKDDRRVGGQDGLHGALPAGWHADASKGAITQASRVKGIAIQPPLAQQRKEKPDADSGIRSGDCHIFVQPQLPRGRLSNPLHAAGTRPWAISH